MKPGGSRSLRSNFRYSDFGFSLLKGGAASVTNRSRRLHALPRAARLEQGADAQSSRPATLPELHLESRPHSRLEFALREGLPRISFGDHPYKAPTFFRSLLAISISSTLLEFSLAAEIARMKIRWCSPPARYRNLTPSMCVMAALVPVDIEQVLGEAERRSRGVGGLLRENHVDRKVGDRTHGER